MACISCALADTAPHYGNDRQTVRAAFVLALSFVKERGFARVLESLCPACRSNYVVACSEPDPSIKPPVRS